MASPTWPAMLSLGLLGLGLLILVLLLRELTRIAFAKVPERAQEQLIGAHAPAVQTNIPRIIWSYWEPGAPPPLIQQCLNNWREQAPDHELRLLNRRSLLQWIDADILSAGFDGLPAYRQADWLRVQLLARHGGIWMDASTLLCRNLDWVHEQRARTQAEYLGFYLDSYSNRPALPLIENWFMAAVPASPFVIALAKAFDEVLALGAEANLQRLREQGRLERVVQKLTPDFQRYLLMHMAASDLLDLAPEQYRLSLLRAEDSALGFHAAVGWRKRHLFARLALLPCPARLPVLIKLRGNDRRVVEQGLAKGRWIRSSALARLLKLTR